MADGTGDESGKKRKVSDKGNSCVLCSTLLQRATKVEAAAKPASKKAKPASSSKAKKSKEVVAEDGSDEE